MKKLFRFRTEIDIGHNDGIFIKAQNITEAKRIMEKEYPQDCKENVQTSIREKGTQDGWKILWSNGIDFL